MADFFFNFADIKTDIDLCAPVGMITDYFYYCLEQHEKKQHIINYKNYLKLCRE
jgi:hypothetical protein